MEKTFNILKAAEAQKDYQQKNDCPDFAPSNGLCYRCKQNIYTEMEDVIAGKTYKSGISVEEAATTLVTGCPHCNRSYCD